MLIIEFLDKCNFEFILMFIVYSFIFPYVIYQFIYLIFYVPIFR